MKFGRLAIVLLSIMPGVARGADSQPLARRSPAERGYDFLLNKPYLPPDFDQAVFDELWTAWEEPLRSLAGSATPQERRRMAFSRYGLTELAGRSGPVAMQYVDDGKGGWVMNCLACHGGKVAGQVIPGLPNSTYALQTLTEDVRATKLRLNKPLSHMDLGSATMPLGGSIGTTNAVMFGVVLLNYRDSDLNVRRDRLPPRLLHHDSDAPPWWHMKKKTRLYADGFVAKGHRPLMQFLLIPKNGPEKFTEWEQDYADILAWMESLEAPPFPFEIDRALAARGEPLFVQSCSECHGTYASGAGGQSDTYPERIVPIDVVGTDPTRLDAMTTAGRQRYHESWFNHYGAGASKLDPGGYLAPPLDGIWATAPYLHNGSVPTLWHLFHPSERPVVWHRTEDGYDAQHVGLEITAHDDLPESVVSAAERRRYFDTRQLGKSAEGHQFPDQLDDGEKRAVLEYLKTL